MKELSLDRLGADAAVQLLLVFGPRFDPEFNAVAIKQTMTDARCYVVQHEAVATLGQALSMGSRAPGLVRVLLARVDLFGWQWRPEFEKLQDAIGCFCLWSIGPQELEFYMSVGWQQRVAAQVSYRPDF